MSKNIQPSRIKAGLLTVQTTTGSTNALLMQNNTGSTVSYITASGITWCAGTLITTPPSGSVSDLLLTWNSSTKNISNSSIPMSSLTDRLWYGIQFDTTVGTTPCIRVGSAELHRSLPIQSLIAAAVIADNKVIQYYLDPSDWTKKLTGGTAVLDGTDGQVMIVLPEFYAMAESVGNVRTMKISQYPLSGFTLHFTRKAIGAYEASVLRASNKLSSVLNTTSAYRGGNNQSEWDLSGCTMLGKPATLISRTNFRTYARNRGTGWEMLDYESHNQLFWLYYTEYANLNCQTAVNALLDINGFRQGGLGNGCTDVNGTSWSTFSSYYPVIPCGASNTLATGTGEVSYTIPFSPTPFATKVCRYRGVELPWGHLWKNCDGVIIDVITGATGTSKAYICRTPANYSDTTVVNYTLVGNIPRADGYIHEVFAGSFLPKVNTGGGSTTYWCDYLYQNIATSSKRMLLLGGAAYDGALAGFGCSITNYVPSYAPAYFGSRLVLYF